MVLNAAHHPCSVPCPLLSDLPPPQCFKSSKYKHFLNPLMGHHMPLIVQYLAGNVALRCGSCTPDGGPDGGGERWSSLQEHSSQLLQPWSKLDSGAWIWGHLPTLPKGEKQSHKLGGQFTQTRELTSCFGWRVGWENPRTALLLMEQSY